MITVGEALTHLFNLVRPVQSETVPLAHAAGRALTSDIVSRRTQPPFAASAMDGYALRGLEAEPDAMFKVIGTSAAGHGFSGRVGAGQAVRIFTGAPLPEGADRVIIQENVERRGDLITLGRDLGTGDNIRPAGIDFTEGDTIKAPRVLSPADVALAASMNHPALTVSRRPTVALIATGDELVMPGETPGPDQIIASNAFGLKAMFEAAGADVNLLPIAKDTEESLTAVFDLAQGADLIVTIGGASVGDHDLVAPVAEKLGMEQSFYKVAMRPGKPLMAGRLGKSVLIGLPGNPVSSMICGKIFVVPALLALQGLPAQPAQPGRARLACDLPENGPREHYMRAALTNGTIAPMDRQDSSLLSILSTANALLIRPINDGPRQAGETVEVLTL